MNFWTLHIFGWPVYKDCVPCPEFWIFFAFFLFDYLRLVL